jgi:hypothetical protein
MIYPSLEVLAAGLDSVRTWCKRRFADRIHARRNTIVITVQVLLCVYVCYKCTNVYTRIYSEYAPAYESCEQ